MNNKVNFTDTGNSSSPWYLRGRLMTSVNLHGAWIVSGMLMVVAILGWLAVKNWGIMPAAEEKAKTDEIIFTRHDATYAASVLDDGSIISVGKYGRIFRSHADNPVWKEISSPTDKDLFGVAFQDGLNGIAVGAGGTYLETADGGLTWVIREIAVTNDLLGVILKPDGSGLIIGSFGLILRADTGGTVWEPVTVPWDKMLSDVWNNVGPVEPHLYDAVVEGSVVWVVGEYGLVLISMDGGKSFDHSRGGKFTDPHLFAVDLLDSRRGIVAGQAGLIATTTNGGVTWKESGNWEADLYDITMYDNAAVISGDLGSVLLLSDITRPAEFQVIAAAGQADRAILGDMWISAVQHIGQGRFLVVGKGSFRAFNLPFITPRPDPNK